MVFLFMVIMFLVQATMNVYSDMKELYFIGLSIFIVPVFGFFLGRNNGVLESTSLALTVACIFYFDYNFPFDRMFNWIPMLAMMIMLLIDLMLGFGVELSLSSRQPSVEDDYEYPRKYLVKSSDVNPISGSIIGTGLNGMHNMLNKHD